MVQKPVVVRAYVYFWGGFPEFPASGNAGLQPTSCRSWSRECAWQYARDRGSTCICKRWCLVEDEEITPQNIFTIDTLNMAILKKEPLFSKPSFWVSMLVFAGVYVRHVRDTADGKNPASQLRLVVDNPWFIGFYTSQVVQDFFHQQLCQIRDRFMSLKDVIYRRL